MIFTMMEACRETGMTYQGLKFYCNAGLVPNVKRDRINRRVFDENDIAWIKSLRQLRKSIKYIDGKQGFYDGVLSGAAEYVSNLLPCSCS